VSLVVLESVTLSFGDRTIIDGLDLRIAHGDRIGLIGPNGSGKTSLLRLIAREQAPDRGAVRTSTGVRIGYLPQDLAIEGGANLLEFVLNSVPGRADLDSIIEAHEAELHILAEKVNTDEEAQLQTMEVAERLSELHDRRAHYDLHFTEHEALRILAGLGFSAEERERDLGEFSGGWKMRAVLAGLLFQKPDILLLDEPTNHLDMPSVAWFSEFLKRHPGAFMLISHDREFLNEQIARVVTFEPEGVRAYTGDYESYLKQRAEEVVILENKSKNLAKQREKAEQFITRFRAQANKAKAVQSRVKMLEKMETVETREERQVMRFSFPASERAGNEVIRAEALDKAYGDNQVLRDVDLTVQRGEKIGIIGVNGAGKTTLLKVLAGELEQTAGKVTLGHKVKLGYYAQHHAEKLDPTRTIYEEVYGHSHDAGVTRVRTLLGSLLFRGDDVDKYVRVLSGGERARVALAKLLIDPGNLMLMDEPTNHLDLESSESLAEALATYDGTLVFVSHNRSFVRRLATRIWDVADGHVETYPGTLDEYLESSRQRREAGIDEAPGPKTSSRAPTDLSAEPSPPAKSKKRRSAAEEKERKRREAQVRSWRNQRVGPLKKRVHELETRISKLEAEQKARAAQLEDPEVYGDETRRYALLTELQVTQGKLDELTERWGGVVEELEQAEAEGPPAS